MYRHLVAVLCLYAVNIGVSKAFLCYSCTADTFSSDNDTPSCHKPDDTTPTVDCSTTCRSEFSITNVTRSCASCTESTSSWRDVTCCSTDKCNNEGPKGAGWHRCYFCEGTSSGTVCPKEDFMSTADPKTYMYCQGQCQKTDGKGKVLGTTVYTTVRLCSSACVEGDLNFNIGSTLSTKGKTTCCDSDDCNGGRKTSVSAALVVIVIAVALLF